jgi:hypothetical protein
MIKKKRRRRGNPAPEVLGANNKHAPLAQITTGTQGGTLRRMSGGRRSRQKGNREERALVRILQAYGFAAERVPLSGAARGRFGGDVSVPFLGRDHRVESKIRRNGFRELYKWLEGSDFTFSSCAPIALSRSSSCGCGSQSKSPPWPNAQRTGAYRDPHPHTLRLRLRLRACLPRPQYAAKSTSTTILMAPMRSFAAVAAIPGTSIKALSSAWLSAPATETPFRNSEFPLEREIAPG